MTATANIIDWRAARVLLVLAVKSRTHQEHMQDKTHKQSSITVKSVHVNQIIAYIAELTALTTNK
jgi:hypothetical protein